MIFDDQGPVVAATGSFRAAQSAPQSGPQNVTIQRPR